jgi:Uma2 family endonuclease
MVAQPLIQSAEIEPEDFDQFALLPENRDKLFEFIAGEIVEVVSNPQSSNVGGLMLTFLNVFVLQHNLGHVTGADGGYKIGRERYIPDAAFISYRRQRYLQSEDGYNPLPPDLAIEVISPSNTDDDMDVKIANYLAAGTVVWRVKPVAKQIAVFAPGKPVVILGINDVLEGGEVLPGFTLPLKDVFREPPP